MTMSSSCWRGASVIPCADDANVKAKASAINLVIASLRFAPHKRLEKHDVWFGDLMEIKKTLVHVRYITSDTPYRPHTAAVLGVVFRRECNETSGFQPACTRRWG